jgi:hypothetical protein
MHALADADPKCHHEKQASWRGRGRVCDPSQAVCRTRFADPTRSRFAMEIEQIHHHQAARGHASVVGEARTEPNSRWLFRFSTCVFASAPSARR